MPHDRVPASGRRHFLTLATGAGAGLVSAITGVQAGAAHAVPVAGPLAPAGASSTADRGSAPRRPGLGVFLPAYPGDPRVLQVAADAAGTPLHVVTWYAAWSDRAAFPLAQVREVAATGAVPEITWEPWDPALGTAQASFSPRLIAAGAHDAYVRDWAAAAATHPGRVRIRFAHEMNGSWYPWAVGVAGTTAAQYRAAWRRVVGIFDAAGARNVRFVWCPNVPFPGSSSLAAAYPGHDAVHLVGLDGYNFATPDAGGWRDPASIFTEGLDAVRRLSTRPVVIGEVACAELGDGGAAKAAWITDFFRLLARRSEVVGFTWFNAVKERDWRVESTQASLEAFRAGLAAR